jgi:hypothetical protein
MKNICNVPGYMSVLTASAGNAHQMAGSFKISDVRS